MSDNRFQGSVTGIRILQTIMALVIVFVFLSCNSNLASKEEDDISLILFLPFLLSNSSTETSTSTSTGTGTSTATETSTSTSTSTSTATSTTTIPWVQQSYIKASNARGSASFGNSVGVDGDTVVVGAPYEGSSQTTVTNGTGSASDISAPNSGAVYVYKRTGSTWIQEAYIKASNADQSDFFGYCVSINQDTVAVGVYSEDSNQTTITNGNTSSSDNSAMNSGAVFVYKRAGVVWAQEAYIKASNAEGYDHFGKNVSIDGDTIAVGAVNEDSNQTTITNGTGSSSDNTVSSSGAVYVYKRTGSTWIQEAYIKASNAESGDFFGDSVAIDGDTIVVGAYNEDSSQTTITNGTGSSSDNSASYSGAVYVYKRTGVSWGQEAYIKASNAGANDYFGGSVAIDGDTIAVGAVNEDSNQTTMTNGTGSSSDNTVSSSGAVYVYKRTGVSWEQEAYIKASDTDIADYSGGSVAIDGDTIVVGAYGEASSQTTISDGTGFSYVDNTAGQSGAVYVYKRTGSNWAPEAYIKASNAEVSDYFGHNVAIDGETIVVGARNEDSSQTTITNGTGSSRDNSASDSGAGYVYVRR